MGDIPNTQRNQAFTIEQGATNAAASASAAAALTSQNAAATSATNAATSQTAAAASAATLGDAILALASGKKIASGVAAITGTGTVVTGLATVTAIVVSVREDLDGVTIAAVSGTIGDQAGTPAAGSVNLSTWKATSNANPTLIPATVAAHVNWIAFGT